MDVFYNLRGYVKDVKIILQHANVSYCQVFMSWMVGKCIKQAKVKDICGGS